MDRTLKSWTIQVIVAVAALIALVSTFARSGIAAEGRERWEMPRGPEIHHEWHGDIRRFHEEDLPRWRAGHWFHGDHLGQAGWWWVVDGGWYFYPAPIYPYPDPYVPPSIVVQGPPPPPPSPSSEYWYYCASARAYYPYAPTCPEGWMQVVPQR
jgi:hypothetical protein